MRLGFIGPAESDLSLLERAVAVLVDDLESDAVVYLADDEALAAFVRRHDAERADLRFEERVARVAATGSPSEIVEVVRALRGTRYLEKLRLLPNPPSKSIEMLDDRIVLLVRHKSSIGEEDVINSNVVVYGDGKELAFKRYGPRCFFCPGPLREGHLGLLDDASEGGGVCLRAVDLDGDIEWTEGIQGRGAKMMVAP